MAVKTCAVAAFALACGLGVFAQAPPAQPASGSAVVAGLVVSAEEQPVPGTVVALAASRQAPDPRSAPAAVAVRVNDEGRFVITGVHDGSYFVRATRAGWLPGSHGRHAPGAGELSIDVKAGQIRNDVRITLWKPGVIAGTARDDLGDPLVNVEVRAVPLVARGGRLAPGTPIRLKTDDTGAYRFGNLLPGRYVVAALASTLTEPPGFATGSLAGRPREYLQTMAQIGTAPMIFDNAATTGSSRGLVRGLAPLGSSPDAEAAWMLYPTTYHPSSTSMAGATTLTVRAGEVHDGIDITAVVQKTWQISGVVRDAQGPAARHAVHLVASETGDLPLIDVATAVTDATGAYTLHGVPPGSYIVRVVKAAWPVAGELDITGGTGAIPVIMGFSRRPGSGGTAEVESPLLYADVPVSIGDRHLRGVDVTLQAGPVIRGRVQFAGTATAPTPKEFERFEILPQPASGRVDSVYTPGRVFADGTFVVPAVWPGKYVFGVGVGSGAWSIASVTTGGREWVDRAIDVTKDIDDMVITFVDQSTTVNGSVVVDASRETALSVLVFPAEQELWLDTGAAPRRLRRVPIAPTGQFSISGLPEGRYRAVVVPTAETSEWTEARRLESLAAEAQAFALARGESLQLTLRWRSR
jgi:hypothetical protein